jgi:hypothetical protein
MSTRGARTRKQPNSSCTAKQRLAHSSLLPALKAQHGLLHFATEAHVMWPMPMTVTCRAAATAVVGSTPCPPSSRLPTAASAREASAPTPSPSLPPKRCSSADAALSLQRRTFFRSPRIRLPPFHASSRWRPAGAEGEAEGGEEASARTITPQSTRSTRISRSVSPPPLSAQRSPAPCIQQTVPRGRGMGVPPKLFLRPRPLA